MRSHSSVGTITSTFSASRSGVFKRPVKIHAVCSTTAQLLGWQFRQALADDELEFLEQRWLKVEVRDLGLKWFVTVNEGKLQVSQHQDADVSFSADANDLILIAARKEDPDTLFFQRRLRIEGDTELGLYVKNLMDAIDLDAMPKPLRFGLLQLAEFVDAGMKEVSTSATQEVSPC